MTRKTKKRVILKVRELHVDVLQLYKIIHVCTFRNHNLDVLNFLTYLMRNVSMLILSIFL
jgi:hypothetical protein